MLMIVLLEIYKHYIIQFCMCIGVYYYVFYYLMWRGIKEF